MTVRTSAAGAPTPISCGAMVTRRADPMSFPMRIAGIPSPHRVPRACARSRCVGAPAWRARDVHRGQCIAHAVQMLWDFRRAAPGQGPAIWLWAGVLAHDAVQQRPGATRWRCPDIVLQRLFELPVGGNRLAHAAVPLIQAHELAYGNLERWIGGNHTL